MGDETGGILYASSHGVEDKNTKIKEASSQHLVLWKHKIIQELIG